jgi:hypothetical protein
VARRRPRGSRTPAAAGAAATHAPIALPFWLVLALLATPRLARLTHPQIWIEDESYLTGAFEMLAGRLPFRDTPMAHFPLLEGMLAAVVAVLPASIRTAEILTQVATFAAALFVYRLGRQMAGPGAALAAGLLFSTSSVVFRYHVFEREIFVILPVLAATWLALHAPRAPGGPARVGPARTDLRVGLTLGALLSIAALIKLSALPYAAVLAGFLAAARGGRTAAVVLVLTVTAAIAAASLLFYAPAGDAFLVQVYLFRRAIPGAPSIWVRLNDLRMSLDLPLALGLVGIGWMTLTGRLRVWSLPLAMLACPVLMYVVLNVTYWSHNGIELLPWLSLVGGAALADIGPLLAGRRSGSVTARGVVSTGATRAHAVAAAITAVLLLAFVIPIRNLNWGVDSVHGFGYRDRREIAELAEVVRSHSAPSDPIAVPPIIAFEANRLELVTYPELAGMLRALEEETARVGYWPILMGRSRLRGQDFWDAVAESRRLWLPQLADAISSRRTPVVINSSPADLFPVPLIDVPEETLQRYGYTRVHATANYAVCAAGRVE